MFVGRQAELDLLTREFSTGRSSFVPIYGRRRIGKSELILRFIEDKPAIYLLGKQAPAQLQRAEFLRQAAAALDEPLLESYSAASWEDAFERATERWRGDAPLVIALDEFQWMVEHSAELPSTLQALWDRKWKRSGKVFLILCGSYVGFMEREVLGKKSPLFGRRTAQILLRPFDYVEASAFFPKWSIEHRALAYFVCGGVAWYLSLFDPQVSARANLEHLLFNEYAPLFREPDFLLREELRDTSSYHAVLVALAQGTLTTKEIADRSGLPGRSLPYYIEQLIELGYVARRYPIARFDPPARHVRYALEDPLLRFWFRFLFPNRSLLAQAGGARVFSERVKPELESYFGHCFERLCQQFLAKRYGREGVSRFLVGEYWDKGVQIDVVGLRDDNWTDLGECKWGAVRSPAAVEQDLARKIALYPNPRGATLAPHVFVKKKPSRAAGKHWHDLEDVYAS